MHHPTDIIFSQILTIGIQGPQVDVMLIRLVDMGFSGMFSDPHCRYIQNLQVNLVLDWWT